MSFGSDLGKEFDKIKEIKLDRSIRSTIVNLRSDLIEASPVDSGELRTSWEQPEQVGRYKWVIRNIAPHALIIDGGRREVPLKNGGGNKMVGSEQLPTGFGDIVDENKKQLQKVLNK